MAAPRVAFVDTLVKLHGPVGGLQMLEDAEAACWRWQAVYAEQRMFGAARGMEAAAYQCRADQFDLVGRYA